MNQPKIELKFVPPRIQDASRPLVEAVSPEGWQNLGGGLRWYEFAGPIEENNGKSQVPISYTGLIGPIVKGLVESQRETGQPSPPNRSYLLHGPAGIGKTLLNQLLAETFISKDHEPVGFYNRDTFVEMIDVETRQPLVINPMVKRPSVVERAMATESLDNPQIQVYNTGKGNVNIHAIDKLVENLKRAYHFGRRVFIIGEIDGIRHDQSKSLKTGLDPHHGIADNILVLADTNDPEKVKNNLKAGYQRFKRIPVRAWHEAELAGMAKEYAKRLGVAFDPSAFSYEDEPFQRMAMHSQGAIRELLYILDELKHVSGMIDASALESHMNRDRSPIIEPPRAVFDFFSLPRYDLATVAAFTTRMALRNTSTYSFVNGLAQYISRNYPQVLGQISQPYFSLSYWLNVPQDGLSPAVWAGFTAPLAAIGEAVRTAMRQNAA